MKKADLVRFALQALLAHRLRTFLSALGIAVGIAAVILLTSIGQGLERFVIAEFTQFGANIISVTPDKTRTHGGGGLGEINSTRPLSLDDAQALTRAPYVLAVNPTVQGNGEVQADGRSRRVLILGASHALVEVLRIKPALGQFLPADDPRAARAFAVLGAKAARELFGEVNPLGARVRVAGERYRVIGVMESKGQVLGFDLDDTVYIPVGRALETFNREGVMEIQLSYEPTAPLSAVEEGIRTILSARHGGEDFTITPQQKMLEVFSSVLGAVIFAVAAIGAVSLLVGAIGILTILTIAVAERTTEIGLMRALGATRRRVLWLFLAEAALLAAIGGLAGLTLGYGLAGLIGLWFPALPITVSWPYALTAELSAIAVGLLAGVLPARHAARLDPLEALRSE